MYLLKLVGNQIISKACWRFSISELKFRISAISEAQIVRAERQLKPSLRAEGQALRAKAQLIFSELKPNFWELKPRVSVLKPKLLELKPKFSLQHDQDLTPKHNEKNDPKTFQNRSKNHQKSIKNRYLERLWGPFGLQEPPEPSGIPSWTLREQISSST